MFTSHELARRLLTEPDVLVIISDINGKRQELKQFTYHAFSKDPNKTLAEADELVEYIDFD